MNAEGRPRRLTLGVMGHVDHGKTALVGALTGMDTDRLSEEKRRGVSIALGFAHAGIGGVEVDFIDMPGHERFVRTLVSGATGVDAALLVVAANEGVKPQTREHLDIAALLGIARVLPVVTKADLANAERAAQTLAAVRTACGEAGIAPQDGVVISVRNGQGLADLRAAIAKLAEGDRAHSDAGFAWLPIDRAFTVPGRGTVVTGTLRRGRLQADAPLVLLPSRRPVRIRELQVHGQTVGAAEPGQRVAVNLRDLDPGEVPRGFSLASPEALTPTRRLTVRLRTLPSAAPLTTGARLSLLVGAVETPARVRLLEVDSLAPGGDAFAQLDTAATLAVPAGEPFVLRLPSPAATTAGGEVLDPDALRLRRKDLAVRDDLARLASAAPEGRPAHLLGQAGARGVPLARLALISGLAPWVIAARLAAFHAEVIGGGLAISTPALTALADRLVTTLREALADHPRGMTRSALSAAAPNAASAALDAALQRLGAEGRVQLDGAVVRLTPPRAQAEVEAAQALALARLLAGRLRAAALTPPELAELAASPAARRTLDALVNAGVAVRTLDRVQKRELVFHREAVAAACARLAPHLTPPGLTVGEVGAHLGVSRKFSVPLLEYLDSVRFTRRLGDRRVLGPAGPPC